ncbi:MAG: DUF2065 domain-containing protein [Solirubrobacterales bacterium]
MRDFLTALSLAMVIEGVAYALFPAAMKRMMSAVVGMPPGLLRAMGLAAAVTGVVSVWMVRSATMAP